MKKIHCTDISRIRILFIIALFCLFLFGTGRELPKAAEEGITEITDEIDVTMAGDGVDDFQYTSICIDDEDIAVQDGYSIDTYNMMTIDATSGLDGGDDYAYNLLNAKQQQLYSAAKTAIQNFIKSDLYKQDLTSETRVISTGALNISGLSISDIQKVGWSVLFDNPQFYFFVNSISTIYTNNQTAAGVEFFVDQYYWSAKNRKTADDAIASVTEEWLALLKPEDNTVDALYETALTLHDLLIERVDYKYNSMGKPEAQKWAHNLAGLMTGQGVVCEGYAKTYQYFLNLLGIENIYIVGVANGGGHAWNSICLNENYYLVDVTWDDRNNGSNNSEKEIKYYTYFCMPENIFDDKHTPDNEASLYALPDFSESEDFLYYSRYKSWMKSSTDNVSEFVSQACDNAPGDYIHFLTRNSEDMKKIYSYLGVSSYSLSSSPLGSMSIYRNVKVSNPATKISLNVTSAAITVSDRQKITATLTPSGSDDRIMWKVDNPNVVEIMLVSGNYAWISGKSNGTAVLTATTEKGKASTTCKIVVGTGVYIETDTIWAGGNKNNKTTTLTTDLQATNWTDAKNKSKKGKLVWLVKNQKTTIEFDRVKHTLKTKKDKGAATVSSKGKVSAKKAGTAYIYVCDTGSMTYKEYIVTVRQAPTKLQLTSVADSAAKDDLIKKLNIQVGDTETVYLIPYVKDGKADSEARYTVELDKETYAQYVTVSDIETDAQGNLYFEVTGKAHNTAKNSPSKVKLNVTNAESGKKTSLSVSVGNPLTSFSVEASEGKLDTKKSTVTLTLTPETVAGDEFKTTDSIKIYVAQTSVLVNGKKVVYDKGATVKAKYNKNNYTVTLTASKDAGVTAVIFAAGKDALTKEIYLYKLASVDKDGNVTVY